ncbi:universal stress protein [Pseudonocardia xishanensis]|uniref:universal stress protein n=1 Tax=Pseudonocardia xishanensis TaxID=630995 RepID=UPI0031E52BE3
MTRPVVVGVDGSGPARQAAAWAAQEADLRDAPLQIACVLERVPAGPPLVAEAILARCASVAHIAAPSRVAQTGTWFGRPAPVLSRLAAHAELLVVGHHGSGRVRPAPGSTAARLARRHVGALAVVRHAPGRPLPDRGRPVVVAVDGEPGSAALAHHAAALAALRGAELSVVHVRRDGSRDGAGRRESYTLLAERALEELTETFVVAHPGLTVHTTVAGGRPALTLLEHAEDAQFVLVGRHAGLGVGACATVLLQASACPVLIVDPARVASALTPA